MEQGDLVRISPSLEGGSRYSGVFMNPLMCVYCNHIYKISDITSGDIFHLTQCEIDSPPGIESWIWHRTMLCPPIIEQQKRLFLD